MTRPDLDRTSKRSKEATGATAPSSHGDPSSTSMSSHNFLARVLGRVGACATSTFDGTHQARSSADASDEFVPIRLTRGTTNERAKDHIGVDEQIYLETSFLTVK